VEVFGMSDPERRRHRLRHASPMFRPDDEPRPDGSSMVTAEVHDPHLVHPDGPDVPPFDDRDAERGLRSLVGAGSSQLSVGAALRARDAARPTDTDLAAAAERVVLVRRNWVPRPSR
jgi:hypothetical protein